MHKTAKVAKKRLRTERQKKKIPHPKSAENPCKIKKNEQTKLMDINVSTIKSYCRRYGFADTDLETSGFCKMCRTPITQAPHRKKKEFCGNNCRVKWFYHKKKLVTKLEAELNENFDDE